MSSTATSSPRLAGQWNRTLATVGYVVLLAGVLPIFPLGWIFVVLGLGFLLLSCYEPGHGFYLIGPLTALEALPSLRRRSVWVKRLLIVAVASLVFYLNFGKSDLTDLNRVAYVNYNFVSMVGTGLVLYVFIIGLNNFTNQVHRYKSGKQWEVLRTTDLRHREIVSGLILGKFPLILEPVLTITPLLMVMPLFGGVSPWVPLMVLLLAVCTGLNVATVATYFSLKRKTSAGAAGMCWAVYGGYLLSCLAMMWMFDRRILVSSGVIQWFMSGFGFNFALSKVPDEESRIVLGLLETCSFHAMVSLLFFLLATQQVPGRQRLEASSEKSEKVASQPRRKRKPIKRVKMWDDAPIAWWQAMHWMNGVQSAVNRWLSWPMAIFVTFLLIAAFAPVGMAYMSHGFMSDYRDNFGRTNLLFFTGITFRVLVIICLLPSLFRGLKAILREKNGDTWDSLLLSPISRQRIVYEKWWGVLLSERPAFYLLCAILLAQTLTGLVSYTGTVEVLVGLPAMMAFWSAVGLYLSSRMNTVFQATTTAGVILITYIIAASIILGSITNAFGGGGGQYFIGFSFNTVIPAFLGFVLMESDFSNVEQIKFGGLFGTAVGSGLHIFGASLLLRATVRQLNREKDGSPKR